MQFMNSISGVSGKVQNGWCRMCVDGQLFREVVATKEVIISLFDKLECETRSVILET